MEGIGPSPRDSTTYDQEMEGERVLVLSIFSVVWPRHTAWVSSICCLQACPTRVSSMADTRPRVPMGTTQYPYLRP